VKLSPTPAALRLRGLRPSRRIAAAEIEPPTSCNGGETGTGCLDQRELLAVPVRVVALHEEGKLIEGEADPGPAPQLRCGATLFHHVVDQASSGDRGGERAQHAESRAFSRCCVFKPLAYYGIHAQQPIPRKTSPGGIVASRRGAAFVASVAPDDHDVADIGAAGILDLATRLFDRLSLALGFDPQVVAVAMTVSQRGPAPSPVHAASKQLGDRVGLERGSTCEAEVSIAGSPCPRKPFLKRTTPLLSVPTRRS
jgi:hypothetical protein